MVPRTLGGWRPQSPYSVSREEVQAPVTEKAQVPWALSPGNKWFLQRRLLQQSPQSLEEPCEGSEAEQAEGPQASLCRYCQVVVPEISDLPPPPGSHLPPSGSTLCPCRYTQVLLSRSLLTPASVASGSLLIFTQFSPRSSAPPLSYTHSPSSQFLSPDEDGRKEMELGKCYQVQLG